MSSDQKNYCNYRYYALYYKPCILSGLYEVLLGMRETLGSEDDSLIVCAVDRILCHLDRVKPSNDVLIDVWQLKRIMVELTEADENECRFNYGSFLTNVIEASDDAPIWSFKKDEWYDNMGRFLRKLDLLYFQLTHDIIRDKMTIHDTDEDGIVKVEGNCVREETSNQKK